MSGLNFAGRDQGRGVLLAKVDSELEIPPGLMLLYVDASGVLHVKDENGDAELLSAAGGVGVEHDGKPLVYRHDTGSFEFAGYSATDVDGLLANYIPAATLGQPGGPLKIEDDNTVKGRWIPLALTASELATYAGSAGQVVLVSDLPGALAFMDGETNGGTLMFGRLQWNEASYYYVRLGRSRAESGANLVATLQAAFDSGSQNIYLILEPGVYLIDSPVTVTGNAARTIYIFGNGSRIEKGTATRLMDHSTDVATPVVWLCQLRNVELTGWSTSTPLVQLSAPNGTSVTLIATAEFCAGTLCLLRTTSTNVPATLQLTAVNCSNLTVQLNALAALSSVSMTFNNCHFTSLQASIAESVWNGLTLSNCTSTGTFAVNTSATKPTVIANCVISGGTLNLNGDDVVRLLNNTIHGSTFLSASSPYTIIAAGNLWAGESYGTNVSNLVEEPENGGDVFGVA